MKYLLIIVALLVLHPAFCQQETPDCGFYGTKTVAERNALFPFNKAKKVVLVSYFGSIESSVRDIYLKENDSASLPPYLQHIIRKDTIKLSEYEKVYQIVEEKMITGAVVDSLSNIMFNYMPEGGKVVDDGGLINCYDPRNSVLFYDGAGNLIANLEICFMCGQAYFEPGDEIMDRLYYICPEVMDLLEEFFADNGIKKSFRKR